MATTPDKARSRLAVGSSDVVDFNTLTTAGKARAAVQDFLQAQCGGAGQAIMVLDAFAPAFVGVAVDGRTEAWRAVYDVDRIIAELEAAGMDNAEALETFGVRMVGAYDTEAAPLFIRTTPQEQPVVTSETSDGYHTFGELYHQRAILFAAIINGRSEAWKSKLHHDGSMFDGGYFIVGIETPEGQYTYHYELELWDLFQVKELDRAPEWDGHTAADVERVLSLR